MFNKLFKRTLCILLAAVISAAFVFSTAHAADIDVTEKIKVNNATSGQGLISQTIYIRLLICSLDRFPKSIVDANGDLNTGHVDYSDIKQVITTSATTSKYGVAEYDYTILEAVAQSYASINDLRILRQISLSPAGPWDTMSKRSDPSYYYTAKSAGVINAQTGSLVDAFGGEARNKFMWFDDTNFISNPSGFNPLTTPFEFKVGTLKMSGWNPTGGDGSGAWEISPLDVGNFFIDTVDIEGTSGATKIGFDDSSVPFTATTVQDALEQVVAGGGATGDINDGGNANGAAITIGTNDNFDFNIETNNLTRMKIENDGDLEVTTGNLFMRLGDILFGTVGNEIGLQDTGTNSGATIIGTDTLANTTPPSNNVQSALSTFDTLFGNLAALTTAIKTDLVSAINEVNSNAINGVNISKTVVEEVPYRLAAEPDGTNNLIDLEYLHSSTDKRNVYQSSTGATAKQDIDAYITNEVYDDFTGWDPILPQFEIDFKTLDTNTSNNSFEIVKIIDSSGASIIPLCSIAPAPAAPCAPMASLTWASIIVSWTGGTFTQNGDFIVHTKISQNNLGDVKVGGHEINYTGQTNK